MPRPQRSPIARDRSKTDRAEQARLLERFRTGDRDAFQGLVQPELGSLLGLARRLCPDTASAEDLVQETLLRGFRSLSSFRGDASLRTWLFRILVRLATRPSARQAHERRLEALPADVPTHMPCEPDRQSLQRELRDRLAEAMERLPPRQRAALHLRATEGLDYRSIANVLTCSPSAARVAVLAARRSVLARMGRYLEP